MNEWNHLSELVLFALAMQETLKEINRQTAKNFKLRVGEWPTFTHTPTTLCEDAWCHRHYY